MIPAGDLNRKIAFEKPTLAENEYGHTETWAAHTSAWARVRYGSGQERRESAQEVGTQAATFEVNYTTKVALVNVKDRISFDGSYWDITNKALVGLNSEIHFTATREA